MSDQHPLFSPPQPDMAALPTPVWKVPLCHPRNTGGADLGGAFSPAGVSAHLGAEATCSQGWPRANCQLEATKE